MASNGRQVAGESRKTTFLPIDAGQMVVDVRVGGVVGVMEVINCLTASSDNVNLFWQLSTAEVSPPRLRLRNRVDSSTKQCQIYFILFQIPSIMSLTDAAPKDAAKAVRSASHILASLSTSARNHALTAIHDALKEAKQSILAANSRDLLAATKAAEDGQLSLSILARLDLGKPGKFDDMLKGIRDVRDLEDPGQ